MPPSPESANSPTPQTPPPGRQQSFPWFWFGIFTGTLLSTAGLALAAWAWIFIHDDLSPVISRALTNSLERPVDLGEVESVTLNSIRVGPSTVGASDEDATTLTAEGVVVKFNLLKTLLTSRLGLDLTVEGAQGYIEQDADKGWLNVEVPEREDDGKEEKYKIRLDDIRIRDSQLTLVPLPAEGTQPVPIPINQLNGSVSIDKVTVAGEEANRTRFDVTGDPEAGGELTVKGEVYPIEKGLIEKGPEASEDALSEDKPETSEDAPQNNPDDESALQLATNLSIQADKAPLADILSFTLSTINIPSDQVTIDSGQVSGTMDMDIRPGEMVDYSGVLSVDDADIDTALLPLPVQNAEGQTHFQGNKWTIDQLSGQYGEIDIAAEGLIDFDNGYNLDAIANNVTVEEFTNTIDLDLPVPTEGTFDAVATMQGAIDKPTFSGSATATKPLTVDRLTFTSAVSNFFLQGQQLTLDDIAATPSTGGSLRGSGQVRLAEGSPFTFQIAGRALPAREIAKIYDFNPDFRLGLVSADATVVGNSGAVTTTVDWDAPGAEYPGRGTLDIANGTDLAFRDTVFQLAGGTVTGTGLLVNGLWDADVRLANVNLNEISEDLIGEVSGDFNFSGNTEDTRIGAIAGDGTVAFSNGLATFNPEFATLNQPLTAQVAWNGQQIEILQSSTERITATGTITPLFSNGFDGLERFDLNINAQDYDINGIPFVKVPDIFTLAGRADFTGTLAGKPEDPSISGDVRGRNIIVNNLPFNPLLTGSVNYTPEAGLALNVIGQTDTIALNVGPAEPSGIIAGAIAPAIPALDFNINWRNAFARGQTQGDLLNMEAGNFPLSALSFPPDGTSEIGKLRGTLTEANGVFNLANQTLESDIVIDQLGLGYIGAGRLAGNVRYADSLATITGGQFIINEHLYTLNGRLAIDGPVPVYSANIETQEGNIQGLLTALSIYRLEDFRRGLTPPSWIEDPLAQSELDTLLSTSRTGDPNATLLNQLRRLAEIQTIQEQQAIADANAPLPPLKDLSGPFAGNLQLNGSGSDFQLDFDLIGDNWHWGEDYSAQEVIATGNLTPNILTLEPVRLASVITPSPNPASPETVSPEAATPETVTIPVEVSPSSNPTNPSSPNLPLSPTPPLQTSQAAINLAGQLVFGSTDTELTSTLQATAQNLDISALGDILQIPIDIRGLANAQASVGGTLANPLLRGLIELDSAAINNTPITAASTGFIYQNARLGLKSTLTATAPEHPLTLEAQIPYAFNFMEVQPETQDIIVDINVQDEGLALLNIFNKEVAWESGNGQFNLAVRGTLASPEIEGAANLDDAVLSAAILPEPLTNVTGRATFAGERIIIDTLQGSFSDGQLTAAGTFPLLYPIISGAQLTALTSPPPQSTPEPTENSSENIDTANSENSNSESPNTETPSETNTPVDLEPNRTEDPLFPQPLEATRPLTVNVQNIDLTLEDDLYSGGVNGQIIVGGSALLGGPQIGGQVILSEGQVVLPNDETVATDISDDAQAAIEADRQSNGGIVPQFRDLRLTLGNSVRIVQGNLLNFVADGTLLLNGPPTDLEPEGIIRLRSGRVSLFTTLFRLRGNNNTAQFTPDLGIQNPFLNVSLRASVPEVNTSAALATTPFVSAEVADNSNIGFDNPGSLRTIRVRATVNGPADAIFENLELSSSPPRDENQLIALIGGGFVTALESTVGSLSGSGDSFEGLLNLVSGTILTSVQDFVGNTLSLSEFNLFPVTSASRTQSEEDNDTGLDVAASVGFDVTEDASLSVAKILTDSSNPEFSAGYRLTDALTVRGTTNFDDINQVLLEYELRF